MARTVKRCISSLSAAILIAAMCLSGVPRSYGNGAGGPASSPNTGLLSENCSYAYAAEVPARVAELCVQVSSSPMVRLTWDKTDCDGYKVYRGSKAIARVEAGPGDDLVTYTDEEIEPGASYTYSVRAFKTVSGKEVYGEASPVVKIVDGYTYAAAEAADSADGAAAGAEGSGSIELTGYTGRDEKLVIPSTLDGKKVTGIGDSCFSGNVRLVRVNVPEGIEKIGDYGFECCSRMQKIYLPDSVRVIGNGAFSGCGSLRMADLNDDITSIGDGAFMACMDLKNIYLPAHLRSLGKFAFALCENLAGVTFGGSEIEAIPERAFNTCVQLRDVTLPKSVTTIEKRAFFGCESLISISGKESVTEIGEYAFEGTGVSNLSSLLDPNVTIGFGVFAVNEVDDYFSDDRNKNEKELTIPASATLAEGAFYGSGIRGFYLTDSENANYKVIDGSLYTADGKTLVIYAPMRFNTLFFEYELTEEAEQKIYHVPEGVTRIAPYAFFKCGLEQIYLPSTVTEISDHAFTKSGIAPDLGMLTDYDGNAVSTQTEGISFGEQSFDNWSLEHPVGLADSSSKDSEGPQFPENLTMTSLAGDKCLYREEDFAGFKDIYANFVDWCLEYIEDNKEVVTMSEEQPNVMTYCLIYKGNDHYNQMASALNGDTGKVQRSLKLSGHEYEEMYLMADHGLCLELGRCRIKDDLILYSGISTAFVERIAGVEPGTPVTTQDLIDVVGSTYEEKAMISTAARVDVSVTFASKYRVILMVMAPHDALNSLGTYCIDCLWAKRYGNGGEHEILFSPGARFKVLDVGKGEVRMQYGDTEECTYVMMELLDKEKDPFTPLDEETLPGKTSRGDLFNLANNVKVTWKEVPGAKYYKVYREGLTDPGESFDEPVFVTSKLVGWDNKPGLTNGHKYRYRIVASLTGEGDPSGDSPLSYSKIMYRLKTVAIRSVKNTSPGKVTVKFDRTASGDSYVLQYSEKEDMSGAKTLVISGAENTAKVIGGLKKGKTYYFSIRVRKKADGINYYTTFGVPKKVGIAQ